MIELAAVALIILTGPDGQKIEVNPTQVVTTRTRRPGDKDHFTNAIRCIIHTADGKTVNVVEACSTVRDRLEGR
jgi:hypothetical protein